MRRPGRPAEPFTIVAVDKVIPHDVDTMSDHRPVMIRLRIAAGTPTPDWLRL